MTDIPKINRVYSVDHVGLAESEANVIICASGMVSSSGWGQAHLSAWAYIDVPEDGIQDFDFVAEAPDGIVLWRLTPTSASLAARRPDWMKGVRIHTTSNFIEARIGDPDATCEVRNVKSEGEALPWPW